MVTVYGPREAARICGIPFGTIAAWCFKYKWKKAGFKLPDPSDNSQIGKKDAGDVLREALEKHRDASTLHLAQYTEKASKAAAEHKKPLEVARKVRDVAGVYSTLWPQEEQSGLIEGAILLGMAKPTLNAKEIEEAKVIDVNEVSEVNEVSDVRTGLADPGQAGD